MRKYVQLTLIPEEVSGITAPVLMNHVMEKLHHIFVQFKDKNDRVPTGLSFPEYDQNIPALGKKIRLHAEEDVFENMDIRRALSALEDYLHISAPRPVPEAKLKGYVAYSRVRHDHSREKLIRRRMKRHGLTREQAKIEYNDYERNSFPMYPFVLLSSKSTGSQKYPLYLKQIFLNEPGKAHFSTFGINPSAGVEFF